LVLVPVVLLERTMVRGVMGVAVKAAMHVLVLKSIVEVLAVLAVPAVLEVLEVLAVKVPSPLHRCCWSCPNIRHLGSGTTHGMGSKVGAPTALQSGRSNAKGTGAVGCG
jgi:hypothetical protein